MGHEENCRVRNSVVNQSVQSMNHGVHKNAALQIVSNKEDARVPKNIVNSDFLRPMKYH